MPDELITTYGFALLRFQPEFASGSYSAELQRRVLQRSWLSKKARTLVRRRKGKPLLPVAVKSASLILSRYRKRLLAIRPYYQPLQGDDKRLLAMINCRPSHYVPVVKHRFSFCNSRLVCPWCYARWAREIYEAVDSRLFPATGPPLYLTTGRTHEELFLPPYDLSAIDAWFLVTCGRMANKLSGTIGNFSWCVWRILPNGSLCCYRQYVAVTGDSNLGKALTRREAFDKLADDLRYPVSWLVTDPALAASIFNIQLLHRSFRRYGVFRGNKATE